MYFGIYTLVFRHEELKKKKKKNAKQYNVQNYKVPATLTLKIYVCS